MSLTPSNTSTAVTLQNCDSEPIHIPGAIQPCGALLAFDRAGLLAYVSANAADVLGAPVTLGVAATADAIPADVSAVLVRWLDEEDSDFEPFVANIKGQAYDVIGHRNVDGFAIVELELRADPLAEMAPALSRAYQSVERLRRQKSIESLLNIAVQEIRHITGFDRVMAYRFHPDESGEVVRESRREDLDNWEGRRYPASDIPAQARRLYIKNTLRLISDAKYQPVHLLSRDPSARPLDMSSSVLRSVSPIHLEYMANMGVRASMSVSVVIDGRLWGMIACHHMAPRHVAFGIRMACEVMAQILSSTIASFEAQARAAKVQVSTGVVNRIAQRVWNSEDILAALTQESPTPADLLPHDAALCLWGGGLTICEGIAPRGDMQSIVAALERAGSRTIACTSIAHSFPDLQSQFVPYAGFLACKFDAVHNGWLIWLRKEQVETLVWGGQPEKEYATGALGPRLTPRGSFDEWRQVVRNTCRPWLPEELGAAENLRDELSQITASRTAEMDRARSALLAMLGHDLRDPLQSINVAATLLTRTDGAGARMGERIRTSSGRMQRLIAQVLDLSRLQGGLGLGMQLGDCDLAAIVVDLVEESRIAHPSISIQLDLDAHLMLQADGDRMAQVISNLLSNAIKHGMVGAPILITGRTLGEAIVIHVINDGPPIDADVLEHLFAPFKPQSVGRPRNRSGLGLGLYIADQVVAGHGGRIDVVCEDGIVDFAVVLPVGRSET